MKGPPAPADGLAPALVLTLGRLTAAAAAFLLPVALARLLTPAEFGQYKLLFLVHGTLLSLGELGLAESLYYFLPARPRQASRYLANAFLGLVATGGVLLALLVASRRLAARWLGDAGLELPVALLGVHVALSLASAPLEVVLVARGRHRAAAVMYGTMGALRAVSMVVPVLLWGSVGALLAGAIVAAALRLFLCVALLRAELLPGTAGDARGLAPDPALFREQLSYALPLQLAVALEVIQASLHHYAVALWFAPATYALYAVGCLQIPVADLLASSACNVMMVRMSELRRQGQRIGELWIETTRRLALLFLPMVGVLLALSHDLIVLVFTDAYAGAVPVFRAWLLVLCCPMLQPHGALRALGDTRFLAGQNLVKLLFVLACLVPMVGSLGLPGPVLVTAAAALLGKCMSLVRLGRLERIGARDLLPWRDMAAAALAAGTAAAVALSARTAMDVAPAPGLVAAGASFAAAYVPLAWLAGVLPPLGRVPPRILRRLRARTAADALALR